MFQPMIAQNYTFLHFCLKDKKLLIIPCKSTEGDKLSCLNLRHNKVISINRCQMVSSSESVSQCNQKVQSRCQFESLEIYQFVSLESYNHQQMSHSKHTYYWQNQSNAPNRPMTRGSKKMLATDQRLEKARKRSQQDQRVKHSPGPS